MIKEIKWIEGLQNKVVLDPAATGLIGIGLQGLFLVRSCVATTSQQMGRSYYAVYVKSREDVVQAIADVKAHDEHDFEERGELLVDGDGSLYRVRRDGRLYFEVMNGGGRLSSWEIMSKSPLDWFTPMGDSSIGAGKDFDVATCESRDFSDWSALADYKGIDAPIINGTSVARLKAAVTSFSEHSEGGGAGAQVLIDLVSRKCPLFMADMKVIKETIEPAKREGERYKKEKGEVHSFITTFTLGSIRKTYQDQEKNAASTRDLRTVVPGTVAHAATVAADSITAASAEIQAAASALMATLAGSALSKACLVGTMAFELAADAKRLAMEIRQYAEFKTASEWDEVDQLRIKQALLHCWCLSPDSVEKPLSRCGRCLKAKYCSVGCQKKAWPSHKPLCTKFAAPPREGAVNQ